MDSSGSGSEAQDDEFARYKVFNLTQPLTNSIFERQAAHEREDSNFTSETNIFNKFEYAINDKIIQPIKSPKHI